MVFAYLTGAAVAGKRRATGAFSAKTYCLSALSAFFHALARCLLQKPRKPARPAALHLTTWMVLAGNTFLVLPFHTGPQMGLAYQPKPDLVSLKKTAFCRFNRWFKIITPLYKV